MSTQKVRCPDDRRHEDDVVGCGHEFEQEPDGEGFFDCPNCGIFFTLEGVTRKEGDGCA